MSKEINGIRKQRRILDRRRSRVVLVAGLILMFSALSLGARSWVKSFPLMGASATPDTVTITLRADGFDPASVSRSAGSFVLVINNQSGVSGLTLRLKNDVSESFEEYQVPSGTTTWSREMNLAAGEYTLTEADHPAWLFHITAQ